MAAGFALGLPATMLLALRDYLPRVSVVVGANVCGFFCYLLLYRGLVLFCHAEGTRPGAAPRRVAGFTIRPHTGHFALLYLAGIVGAISLVYFSSVHDRIVPRIVVTSLILALVRALMARELVRHAAGRRPIRFFAWFLAIFSGLALLRAVTTLLYGAPSDFMHYDRIQTASLVGSLLFICIVGLLCLAMVAGTVASSIAEQADHDFLTSSLNRRGIERALAVEKSRTSRTGRVFAVLLIDLDHFKQINDAHGHAAGDDALRDAVSSIASVVRTYDKLGRLGGDEFLLLLPGTGAEEALLIASRIRSAFNRPALETGTLIPITLSIGITLCLREESTTDILARVDAALYEAKRAGRDCARLQPAPTHDAIPTPNFLTRRPAH